MRTPRPNTSALLALPAAVGVGTLISVQSHVNSRLAVALGAGMAGAATTAVLSFGSGLLLLVTACTVATPARRGVRRILAALHAGRLRPWHLVGGAAGALLVAAQGLAVATIGVALFSVAVVAGQTGSALLVDKVGVGPAGRRRVTAQRLVGAVLAVVAVGLGVSDRLAGAAALAPLSLLLAALPFLAGAGAAWQQAFNGRVSVVGGPFPAALVNFTGGTLLLLVLAAATLASGAHPDALPHTWWLYTGGVMGVVFISAAAVLVRVLGVLVFGLSAICGQVVSALLLDLATDVPVGALTVAGAALTLVGVAIATARPPFRRRSGSTDPDDPAHSDAPADPADPADPAAPDAPDAPAQEDRRAAPGGHAGSRI